MDKSKKLALSIGLISIPGGVAFAGGRDSHKSHGSWWWWKKKYIKHKGHDHKRKDKGGKSVPEIDAMAGVAALALFVGAFLLIREKFFRS